MQRLLTLPSVSFGFRQVSTCVLIKQSTHNDQNGSIEVANGCGKENEKENENVVPGTLDDPLR